MTSLVATLRGFVHRFSALGRNARLYLIANSIQALSAGAIGVLYTLYLTALGYGTNFVGLVLFFASLGAGVALFPAGPLVRRHGWRTMLLWSDGVGGIAVFLQLVVPNPIVIFATSALLGASFAVILIVTTPLLAAYSDPEQRTAAFGLNTALGLIAAILGTLLGGVMPDVFRASVVAQSGVLLALRPWLAADATARSYQLAMLAIGLTAIPSVIPIYMMSRDRAGMGDIAEPQAPPVAVALESAGGGIPRERLPLRVGRWLRGSSRLVTGVVGRFSISQALVGFGAGLYIPYLNIYFVDHLHTSTLLFGVFNATLTVFQALAALASAAYAARFGKVRGAVVAQLLSLPFLVTMGLVPALAVVVGAYLMRGTLMSLTGPPLQAFLMDSVAERERITASEAFNVTWQIAGAIGVALGGQLIHALGFANTFYIGGALYAASAVLLAIWFLGPRVSRVALRGVRINPAAYETGGSSGEPDQAAVTRTETH